MLGFFRKKSRDFTQPHKEWPWSLTVNGMPSGEFVWRDVLRELSKLTPDPDHFLILEQQNPQEPGEYWFLQAARSSVGEQAGWYIVECGFSSPEGPVLLHLDTPDLETAAALFKRAFQDGELEVTQFQQEGLR